MAAARKKRRAKASKPGGAPAMPVKPDTPVKPPPSAPPAGKPSFVRRLAFRIAAVTLVPALILGVVELSLRGFGYGYGTGFFQKVPGRDAYEGNPRFGWRFFPRRLARTPSLVHMPAVKAPGTCRIFVLGGSAAMGTPEAAFSFGRVLEVMLREAYPETRFEVINAAMTAINSHAVVDIARDCAARDPDLFLVYMGNNEVVGPFGPGTVFNRFSSRRSAIRTTLRIKKLKIAQLMENALRGVVGEDQGMSEWRGLEMFLEQQVAADDARLESVYGHLRANLEAICATARGARAKVVVGTVAVNLGDCAPFASVSRPDLTQAGKVEWDTAYRAGIAREESGDFAGAIEQYDAAAGIDDGFAGLNYRIGGCYARLDKPSEAARHLSPARDLDVLRFRADSRINRTIREVASGRESHGIWLADAEQALRDRAPGGIPGDRFFYEHVHLTFEGNYELARTFFPKVVAALALPDRAGAPADQEPATLSRCAELLTLTDFDQAEMLEKIFRITVYPPFTNRLDHDRQQEKLVRRYSRLKSQLDAARLEALAATYARAIDRNPGDLHVLSNFARLEMERGNYDNAIRTWRSVLGYLPDNVEASTRIGMALVMKGAMNEARECFDRCLEMGADPVTLAVLIAGELGKRDQPEEAVQYSRKALAMDPRSGQAFCNLGFGLFKLGRHAEALAALKQADQLLPNSVEIMSNLAVAYEGAGDTERAAREFARIVEMFPTDAQGRRDLGRVLQQLGRFEEALVHQSKAVALDPGNVEAELGLAYLLARQGREREAYSRYQQIFKHRAAWPPAMIDLTWLLATASDPAVRNPPDAIRCARAACEGTGNHHPATFDALAAAYAAQGLPEQATAAARKAIELADAGGDKAGAAVLRDRLKRFQDGGAYEQEKGVR